MATLRACFCSLLLLLSACGGGGDHPDTDSLRTSFDSNYKPSRDGFQSANRGSEYSRTGECFGMTAFSIWFYQNHKARRGDFFQEYYDVIASDAFGFPLRGQNIIATRAFISINQKWSLYYPAISAQATLADSEIAVSILNALINTGNPVLVYVSSSTGAHSVLAYRYAPSVSGGTFNVYDPNRPADDARVITYDAASGFAPYCYSTSSCFPTVRYSGDGSLKLAEPFQNVLDDADLSFGNSAAPSIELTSHVSGQEVSTASVALLGKIESSQVLVDKLNIYVGSARFETPIGLSGDFRVQIELADGMNRIRFETLGKDSGGSSIALPNNLRLVDFTLVLNRGAEEHGNSGGQSAGAFPTDRSVARYSRRWPRESAVIPGQPGAGPRVALGPTAWSDAIAVTPEGGDFEVMLPGGGMPVSIAVPARVSDRTFRLRLGINQGEFIPGAGTASGLILALDSDLPHFEEPVQIEVRLNRFPANRVPIAYALDAEGKVKLLDSVWDRSRDVLKVYTFQPIVFTWVFG